MQARTLKMGHATRNRTFDLLRLLFAMLVLMSHAPELMDGNRLREPLTMLAHTPLSFGTVGLDGFFLLSGYLMVQSWEADPHPLNFMRKRVLRIVPGYLVAAILSVVVVGWLAPGVAHYFRSIRWSHLLGSMLTLGVPVTPPVTPGEPSAIVNGALWSIAYEFRCYVLIALLGVLTLLRRPGLYLALTVTTCVLALEPGWLKPLAWANANVIHVVGDLTGMVHFAAIYLIGAAFHIFQTRIVFRPAFAVLAGSVLLLVPRFSPANFENAVVLLGSYLLFYVGLTRFKWLERLPRFPDISYGVYLYGWPVETLLIFYLHGSPVRIFAGAVCICCVLGWLSWHLVERPMLKWKRRPAAPLPAG